MKIVAISDTHNKHNKIEQFHTEYSQGEPRIPTSGDVIIHAGDATGHGEREETLRFLDWFASLKFTHKIFVPGNHDFCFETEPEYYREACASRGITLLINEGIEINGVKFWGSPATPWFHSWAFNYARTEKEATEKHPYIKEIWDQIPVDTDVLITHGPPWKILDQLVDYKGDFRDEWVGCCELFNTVMRLKPKVHIFGHIHCSYGVKYFNGTKFYNAAICGESYWVDNYPHVIDF